MSDESRALDNIYIVLGDMHSTAIATQTKINDLVLQLGAINKKTPTLRDQIAMAALTGICARQASADYYAGEAYHIAEAMLVARRDTE